MKTILAAVTLLCGTSSILVASDVGWPRVKSVGDSTVTLYQPQIDAWPDHRTLDFRMAVAVGTTGAKEPSYGVVVGHADTSVNWQSRTVLISNPRYAQITFPAAAPAAAAASTALLKQALPEGTSCELSLDRILADLEQTQQSQRPVEVNLDPPPIYFSSSPAILVVFTGAPAWQAANGTSLLFATNTNWPLFLQQGTSTCFLLDGNGWLSAPDPVKGPWLPTTTLPTEFSSLLPDESWAAVCSNVPGVPLDPAPTVIVSERPAELIVTAGDPQLVAIANTSLMYVSNSDRPLFLDTKSQTYYFLAAGRWFSATNLSGPWKAAKNLPADFGRIPVDCPRADALSAVPGTPQAQEAILQASIPHTAKVDAAMTTIRVTYDGDPAFVAIPGSDGVQVAQNTIDAVFQLADRCYCCRDGVWFQATAATGPWTVCTQVPPAIYSIPANSPYHNVTYVYVYDTTPTTVVAGYTAGYTGEYVGGGVLVFGAGYWPATIAPWGPYSAWHYPPCYFSYGCAAHYSYYDGGYVRGAAYYGPYGGAGCCARYNPATGVYSRGAAIYGPASAAGVATAYNPWTGRGGATVQATTPYGSWGRTVVSDGSNWAEAGHHSDAWGTTAAARTSAGAAGAVHAGPVGTSSIARTANGNVYAGHDGNVYRNTGDSGWEQRTDAGWQRTEMSSATREQQMQHPSQWGGDDGAGSREDVDRQDINRQLNGDAWGRQRGNYVSSFRGGRRR